MLVHHEADLLKTEITLSWVYAFKSRKIHTCPVTPQDMGKVWNFTRATPLLHQVRVKHPTSHIVTMQQALNTNTTHKHITNTYDQVPVNHHTHTYSQHICQVQQALTAPGACQAPQYPTTAHRSEQGSDCHQQPHHIEPQHKLNIYCTRDKEGSVA